MLRKNAIYLAIILTVTFCVMLYLLVGLDYVSDPPVLGIIGASSISASFFIIIVRPCAVPAKTRNLILGYLVSILIGIAFHFIIRISGQDALQPHNSLLFSILAALSIVITMITFLILKIDHPPAVGMTFGLVLERWTMPSVCIIISAVAIITLIKMYLEKKQINIWE